MKRYGIVEVKLHSFLSSVLDGGEWSASGSGRFPQDTLRDPDNHCGHGGEKKYPVSAGNKTQVAQPFNDYFRTSSNVMGR
jgi:hypothetical protein